MGPGFYAYFPFVSLREENNSASSYLLSPRFNHEFGRFWRKNSLTIQGIVEKESSKPLLIVVEILFEPEPALLPKVLSGHSWKCGVSEERPGNGRNLRLLILVVNEKFTYQST